MLLTAKLKRNNYYHYKKCLSKYESFKIIFLRVFLIPKQKESSCSVCTNNEHHCKITALISKDHVRNDAVSPFKRCKRILKKMSASEEKTLILLTKDLSKS